MAHAPLSTFGDRPTSPRVMRLAPGEDRRMWQDALASFDPRAAASLKADEGAAVWRGKMAGREVVVKAWLLSSVAARIKLVARMARGDRHWRGAAWLMARGFPTARPLVLANDRCSAGTRQWLVMECLDGPTVLDCIAGAGLEVRAEHRLARALADQVSEMVAQGRFNRDHKPSNLIVTGVRDGSPCVAIIDCVAIRRCRKFDFAAMRRMLASLYIEPLGLGIPPRLALCMRALHAIEARPWWRELAREIVEHGDPRSKVDPRPRR